MYLIFTLIILCMCRGLLRDNKWYHCERKPLEIDTTYIIISTNNRKRPKNIVKMGPPQRPTLCTYAHIQLSKAWEDGGLGGGLRGVGGFGEGLGEDGTFLLVGGSKVLGAYIGLTFILANLEGTLSNHPTVSYCWSPKDTRRRKRNNPQGTSDSEAASQQNRRRPTLPSIFTSSPMDCHNLDKCGKTQMHIAPSCPWVCQRDSERLCFTVEKNQWTRDKAQCGTWVEVSIYWASACVTRLFSSRTLFDSCWVLCRHATRPMAAKVLWIFGDYKSQTVVPGPFSHFATQHEGTINVKISRNTYPIFVGRKISHPGRQRSVGSCMKWTLSSISTRELSAFLCQKGSQRRWRRTLGRRWCRL